MGVSYEGGWGRQNGGHRAQKTWRKKLTKKNKTVKKKTHKFKKKPSKKTKKRQKQKAHTNAFVSPPTTTGTGRKGAEG